MLPVLWDCVYVRVSWEKLLSSSSRQRFLSQPLREWLFCNLRAPLRSWRYVQWTKPPAGFLKLNTDGASHGNPGLVGADGIIRDKNRHWVSCFMMSIGITFSMMAELQVILAGLKHAWELECRRLILEDSLVARNIIIGRMKCSPSYEGWRMIFVVCLIKIGRSRYIMSCQKKTQVPIASLGEWSLFRLVFMF
ncbi:uncharacterized protein LOC116210891 [Punica granatum]|uniref:Uncharacterized protein LOC116210891 n=1 Tax=Punica granatum TaxID=22663 RepID=A0A6P8E721_PUNGR|nr:uncharacterized protein LOC116210891 [Punica granatum]